MARNEEKQLARLNRYYLQQQKDEELKKRPPRPRLDTLCTGDEVKKWIPSILYDIDFYVKQMEVACYPERQIEEFDRRIDCLRGEYKAFVCKVRQLEPDLQATPWTDRPYSKRKRSDKDCDPCGSKECPSLPCTDATSSPDLLKDFKSISTPILNNDDYYNSCYGYNKEKSPVNSDLNTGLQDEPLQFNTSSSLCVSNLSLPAVKTKQLSKDLLKKRHGYGNASPILGSFKQLNHQDTALGEDFSRCPQQQLTFITHKGSGPCSQGQMSSLAYTSRAPSLITDISKVITHSNEAQTLIENKTTSQTLVDEESRKGEEALSRNIDSSKSNTSFVSVSGSLSLPYTDSSDDDDGS